MDALEVAILTVFIAIICCIIYATAISTLHSYNVSIGVFKCLKYVIDNPGSSIVITVYAPHNIELIFNKESNEICVGPTCTPVPNNIQVSLYVITGYNIVNVSKIESLENQQILLFLPKGVHSIKCISYWNTTGGTRFLQVIITLYR